MKRIFAALTGLLCLSLISLSLAVGSLGVSDVVHSICGSLAMLAEFIGKPISTQVESSYTQEEFDIVLM